jgi:hypothetical protein
MLGFHTALELRNQKYSELMSCEGEASASASHRDIEAADGMGGSIRRGRKSSHSGGGSGMLRRRSGSSSRNGQLWDLQAAYSQVGPKGAEDELTTFTAFVTAAAAAATADGPASVSPYLLVASGHCTVAAFHPDGCRVLFVNSLGRGLSPMCRFAHALVFESLAAFCEFYVTCVIRPASASALAPAASAASGSGGEGRPPTQIEAHRVSRQRPKTGETEVLLFEC